MEEKKRRNDKPAPDGYLKTAEAAEYLGVTPMTLWRFVKAGRLNAYRVPGVRANLYDEGELEEFDKAREVAP